MDRANFLAVVSILEAVEGLKNNSLVMSVKKEIITVHVDNYKYILF